MTQLEITFAFVLFGLLALNLALAHTALRLMKMRKSYMREIIKAEDEARMTRLYWYATLSKFPPCRFADTSVSCSCECCEAKDMMVVLERDYPHELGPKQRN